jgi:hypothetical protein
MGYIVYISYSVRLLRMPTVRNFIDDRLKLQQHYSRFSLKSLNNSCRKVLLCSCQVGPRKLGLTGELTTKSLETLQISLFRIIENAESVLLCCAFIPSRYIKNLLHEFTFFYGNKVKVWRFEELWNLKPQSPLRDVWECSSLASRSTHFSSVRTPCFNLFSTLIPYALINFLSYKDYAKI